jgi:transcriptional regulator with GAF, ATPase, and Fis domain
MESYPGLTLGSIPRKPRKFNSPSVSISTFTSFTPERANILATLNKSRWKVYGRGGAAELLGIKPGTLAARMKKLGLRRP